MVKMPNFRRDSSPPLGDEEKGQPSLGKATKTKPLTDSLTDILTCPS